MSENVEQVLSWLRDGAAHDFQFVPGREKLGKAALIECDDLIEGLLHKLNEASAQLQSAQLRLDAARMLAHSWIDSPFTTMDRNTMTTLGQEMLRRLGEKWLAESNPTPGKKLHGAFVG
jgi:hypothetical protein